MMRIEDPPLDLADPEVVAAFAEFNDRVERAKDEYARDLAYELGLYVVCQERPRPGWLRTCLRCRRTKP